MPVATLAMAARGPCCSWDHHRMIVAGTVTFHTVTVVTWPCRCHVTLMAGHFKGLPDRVVCSLRRPFVSTHSSPFQKLQVALGLFEGAHWCWWSSRSCAGQFGSQTIKFKRDKQQAPAAAAGLLGWLAGACCPKLGVSPGSPANLLNQPMC